MIEFLNIFDFNFCYRLLIFIIPMFCMSYLPIPSYARKKDGFIVGLFYNRGSLVIDL